jgi:hypothetical protein
MSNKIVAGFFYFGNEKAYKPTLVFKTPYFSMVFRPRQRLWPLRETVR